MIDVNSTEIWENKYNLNFETPIFIFQIFYRTNIDYVIVSIVRINNTLRRSSLILLEFRAIFKHWSTINYMRHFATRKPPKKNIFEENNARVIIIHWLKQTRETCGMILGISGDNVWKLELWGLLYGSMRFGNCCDQDIVVCIPWLQ
jgi:hypothetical protein